MSNALAPLDDNDFTAPVVASLNYAALAPEQATIVRTSANLIRGNLRNQISAIIEAGRHLRQVKGILGHGAFGQWLAAEFGLSARTAQHYMRAADVYAEKSATVAHLPVGILYQLQAPQIPEEVRAEILSAPEASPIPEDEVKARLVFARAAARRRAAETAEERKLTPEQKKRRKARRERERLEAADRQEARQREYEQKEQSTKSAADYVLRNLDAAHRAELFELLKDADPYEFKAALVAGCESGGGS